MNLRIRLWNLFDETDPLHNNQVASQPEPKAGQPIMLRWLALKNVIIPLIER